jgi:hypothetical protein
VLKFDEELTRYLGQTQTVEITSTKEITALYRKAKALAKATSKTDPLNWLAARLELEAEALHEWIDDSDAPFPIDMDAAITDCLVNIYALLPQLAEKLNTIREDAIILPSLDSIFEKSAIFYANQERAASLMADP